MTSIVFICGWPSNRNSTNSDDSNEYLLKHINNILMLEKDHFLKIKDIYSIVYIIHILM